MDRQYFGVLLMLVASVAAAAQSATLPATRPGQILGEWLALCSNPDLEEMTRWNARNLSDGALQREPAGNRARDDYQGCVANGGYRVAVVAKSDPRSIQLLVIGNRTGIWSEYYIGLDAHDRIDRGRLNPAKPPETALPVDLSDAAVASAVESAVGRASQAGLFSGIVLIARGTQPIARASGGHADRDRRSPITPSTRFTLGSMGKMFTAAAIGQLVDQKKIAFSDSVGKFFPAYPNRTVRDKVTIGMLLSHTSGMGDFLSRRTPEMMKHGVIRASEFMPLYDEDEPTFAPGTGWAYSNAGLALAGAIVEAVSGEAYPDYIRRHIFAPAGMTSSDPNNIPHQDPRRVTPYTRWSENGPAQDWHEAEHDIGSPAGGAISTAEDLMRFADALRGGQLLSESTFAEMAKPRGDTPWGAKYGYAMEIEDFYGRTVVGHGGGFPGVSTHLHILLDSPYTVVVLSNQDPPADGYVGLSAVALMAEKAKRRQ